MKRTEQREMAVKTIYAMHIRNVCDSSLYTDYIEREEFNKNYIVFYIDIVESYIEHRANIEQYIGDITPDYKLNRLPIIDLTIVEVALTEIFYLGIPCEVAIDEAIELSKMYSDADNYKIVNSMLGDIIRNTDA